MPRRPSHVEKEAASRHAVPGTVAARIRMIRPLARAAIHGSSTTSGRRLKEKAARRSASRVNARLTFFFGTTPPKNRTTNPVVETHPARRSTAGRVADSEARVRLPRGLNGEGTTALRLLDLLGRLPRAGRNPCQRTKTRATIIGPRLGIFVARQSPDSVQPRRSPSPGRDRRGARRRN